MRLLWKKKVPSRTYYYINNKLTNLSFASNKFVNCRNTESKKLKILPRKKGKHLLFTMIAHLMIYETKKERDFIRIYMFTQ